MSFGIYKSVRQLFMDSNIIFADNKYFKWYSNIIQSAVHRKNSNQVQEKHHIVPNSLISNNDLVQLTPKEHFVCHLLLPKFLSGLDKHKMICAIRFMIVSNRTKSQLTGAMYEKYKIEHAQYVSSLFKGKSYEERHGIEKAADIKIKQSRAHAGVSKSPDFIKMLQTRQYSDQHRRLISESQVGSKNSNFQGLYHTPFDTFESLEGQNKVTPKVLRKWCRDNNKIMSKRSHSRSSYLNQLDESNIGKTYREIGFWFEPK